MKIKTILLFLLVFVAGGVTGGFVIGQIHKNRIHHIQQQRKPQVFRDHMNKMLGTTREQEHAIDSVMDLYLPRIRKHRMDNQQMVRTMHDSMLLEIRMYLTPEQIDKLDKYEHRLFNKRRHMPEHDGPHDRFHDRP